MLRSRSSSGGSLRAAIRTATPVRSCPAMRAEEAVVRQQRPVEEAGGIIGARFRGRRDIKGASFAQHVGECRAPARPDRDEAETGIQPEASANMLQRAARKSEGTVWASSRALPLISFYAIARVISRAKPNESFKTSLLIGMQPEPNLDIGKRTAKINPPLEMVVRLWRHAFLKR